MPTYHVPVSPGLVIPGWHVTNEANAISILRHGFEVNQYSGSHGHGVYVALDHLTKDEYVRSNWKVRHWDRDGAARRGAVLAVSVILPSPRAIHWTHDWTFEVAGLAKAYYDRHGEFKWGPGGNQIVVADPQYVQPLGIVERF